MEDHPRVNQSWLFLAQFFRGEALSIQIAGAPIREEHVCIFQKVIESGTILFGAIKYRGTHPDLHVPHKSLYLRIVRSPDVEDITTVVGKISANACPGNHVPHSQRANALQWHLCTAPKRYRLTLCNLLHGDQGHLGEHFGVLRFPAKLLVCTNHSEDKPCLLTGRLQFLRTPLKNCIVY